jgi:hypothetical protein
MLIYLLLYTGILKILAENMLVVQCLLKAYLKSPHKIGRKHLCCLMFLKIVLKFPIRLALIQLQLEEKCSIVNKKLENHNIYLL